MERTTGLVLSGGGVRGMAHIGVISVLQEYEIPVHAIAGTSAGALVGAFYAAGYSAQQMLNFFRYTPIFKWKQMTLRRSGLVNTDKFHPFFHRHFPHDNFADLKRELYVTATNLSQARAEVFSTGTLIDKLMASAALPVVFSPVKIGKDYYADGGITNNFPVDVLQERCDNVIGVYANPLRPLGKKGLRNTWRVLERSYHINLGCACTPKFADCDVFISPDELRNYRVMGRRRYLDDIYEIGRQAALEQLDALQGLADR